MIVAIGVIAAVLAVIWTMQRRLIYFPGDAAPTPGEVGMSGVELVTFETTDGLGLSGWFLPQPGPSPRVTVLVFNGNAGNRAHRGPLAAALHRHGFQVLLFDYRGYGGNPGTPTERGLIADSRAARAYLAGRADVDASRIVYFGESLGTAVAIDLAVAHPPLAVVLRSPFTSLVDVGRHHYRFLPVRLLLRDRFASIDQITPDSSTAAGHRRQPGPHRPAREHPASLRCGRGSQDDPGGRRRRSQRLRAARGRGNDPGDRRFSPAARLRLELDVSRSVRVRNRGWHTSQALRSHESTKARNMYRFDFVFSCFRGRMLQVTA